MKRVRKSQDLAFHCTIPLSLVIHFSDFDPDRTQILGIPLLSARSLLQVLIVPTPLVYLFRLLFHVFQALCPLTLPLLSFYQTSSN